MRSLFVLGAVASLAFSASLIAKDEQPEQPRMESLEEQVKGDVVGVNSVEYGGGVLILPIIGFENEICISIVNNMNAMVDNPSKAEDYNYQIAVHCDEVEPRTRMIGDTEVTTDYSKGFERLYLIELDQGIVMHSAKYSSGILKVWPSKLYDDFMVQNLSLIHI